MGHTQLLSVSPLRWVDEGGLPRATNDAYRPAATPPAPRVELREFELRFWTDSDCQGKATITAENREQAKVILMHLPQYSCYQIWAD